MWKWIKKLFSLLRHTLALAAAVIAAVLMCLSIVTLTLSKTVLDVDFMKTQLRENDVYTGVADAVKDSFRGIYRRSGYRSDRLDGLVDGLLDAVIRPAPLQQEMEPILDQVYSGEIPEVSGKYFAADYSDSIYGYISKKAPDTDKSSIDRIVSDVGSAIRENVDLSAVGKAIRDGAAVIALCVGAVYLTCAAVAAVLLVLILILARDKLRWLRLPFLFSGILMVLFSILCLVLLPKDLVLLNAAITGFVYSILRWVILLFFLYGVQNLLISLALRLIRRARRQKAGTVSPLAAKRSPAGGKRR